MENDTLQEPSYGIHNPIDYNACDNGYEISFTVIRDQSDQCLSSSDDIYSQLDVSEWEESQLSINRNIGLIQGELS
jgi:hypothetical protein